MSPFVLQFSGTKKTIEVKKLRSNGGGDDFGDGNCCAAYSLLTVALVVDRKGLVKVMNCGLKNRSWSVNKLEMECLNDGGAAWEVCTVAVGQDGKIGLALDRTGRVLSVRFVEK